MDAHVVIMREEARAQGLKFYFTGEPCCHAHISPRYVNNMTCVQCNRLASRGLLTRKRHSHSTSESFTPEPKWWLDDGGACRVPIYDHTFSPPRLVRRVGWVNCLGPNKDRFFSPDVAKVRVCAECKTLQARVSEGFD